MMRLVPVPAVAGTVSPALVMRLIPVVPSHLVDYQLIPHDKHRDVTYIYITVKPEVTITPAYIPPPPPPPPRRPHRKTSS